MASYSQFVYKECLPVKSQKALPAVLQVKSNSIEEVLILRLLLGTIDLKNVLKGESYKQRKNYGLNDFSINSRLSAKIIFEFFRAERLPVSKVEKYYKDSIKFGNKTFFKNFLLELSNYFYQSERNSHATAFLHLYRAVELISYCFPLYYASRSTSYEKTYKTLKDFFHKADGELSFFRIFVNDHLFKGEPILDIDLPIKISRPRPELAEQYYNALKRLCDNNKNITLKSGTPFSEIVITRRGLTSLIYDLRNRYFHLLSGDYNDNFSSSELAEIDIFYSQVNDLILNWLSLIYLELLSTAIQSH